jgi:hypothetical protein
METAEKQALCLKILQELILLRGVLCATQSLATTCTTAITNVWDEGLGTFIDTKFFAPVLAKYAPLLAAATATLVALPLRLKSSVLVALTSSEGLTCTLEKPASTPSALLWCGLGRTEAATVKGFKLLPVLKLSSPAIVAAKITFQENSHILRASTFPALVHLLHFGAPELLPGTFSEVALALYTAAEQLTRYTFRKGAKKDLSLMAPVPLEAGELTWLNLFSENPLITQTIAKDSSLTAEAYLDNFFQLGENYYKIAATILLQFPAPRLLENYSLPRNGKRHLFDLRIESGAVTKFQATPTSNKGFCFWLGDTTGAIMGHFPRKLDANFAQGLIVTYLTLMSAVTEEGLLRIVQGLPEVRCQYSSYLATLLTVQAAFAPQILPALI